MDWFYLGKIVTPLGTISRFHEEGGFKVEQIWLRQARDSSLPADEQKVVGGSIRLSYLWYIELTLSRV